MRYSVRLCESCAAVVAHWIVRGSGVYASAESLPEAFELVARAEAERLAGGRWWLDEVSPRRVVLQRHGSEEEHAFPSPDGGPATSWQQAAIFLAFLEKANRHAGVTA